MAVNVWIPPLLRRHTQDREELSVNEGTLADILASLGIAGSEVLSLLSAGWNSGAVRVSLFVNGQSVDAPGQLGIALNEGDEVAIVPSIGGGW